MEEATDRGIDYWRIQSGDQRRYSGLEEDQAMSNADETYLKITNTILINQLNSTSVLLFY